MVPSSAGEVVLVSFPFSDWSRSKLRPAVCLADAERGDWVSCQVTSKRYADARAIPLDNKDFVAGGLRIPSFARPGKFFTAKSTLLVKSVGKLLAGSFRRVLDGVIDLFEDNKP